MRLEKVVGTNKDFAALCKMLEDFQFDMLPILREKEYSLTDDLEEIEGFVMYLDKEPIASIGIKKVSQDTCEIVRVYVKDKYRGQGYAKILFEKIEGYAKSLGYKRAEMVAWLKAQSAIKLYKRLNYTSTEPMISEWFGGFEYVELTKEL